MLKSYLKQEIFDLFRRKQIDLIFVDESDQSYKIYLELRANFFDVPVIVVSGHDKFWNHDPEFVRENYYSKKLKLMFLDNWRPEYSRLPYACMYNWSMNFDHLWDPNDREKLLLTK